MSSISDVRVYRARESVSLRRELQDIAAYAHLLKSLVARDLTVRYKRSVLGFFWTMLHPLLLMVIFVVVYSTIFRFAIANYSIYFLSAYLAWNFFAQTSANAMASIGWNGMLMKQVRAPRSIFPLASTIAGLINLLLTMIPLLGIMLIVGAPVRPSFLFVPVSFLILAVFTFGVSLALYSLAVFFVDVRELYTVIIQALLFLTPIIYPLEIVPDKYLPYIKANPLRYLIELARSPIYYGIIPSARSIVISLILAVGAFVFGWFVFRKLSPRFYAHL
jgi:ABC-2 type transport system permease protein